MNFVYKILSAVKDFKYINHLMALSIGFSIALSGARYYLDSQKEYFQALMHNNRPDRAALYIFKGSNVGKVIDILNDLSKVQVRGLWLTSINFNKNRNDIKVEVKAVDQLDISKYNALLSAALGSRHLCLKNIDVKKKGEKIKKKSNENMPLVLRILQQRQEKREAERNANKPIEKDNQESLRWVFNYEASFSYGKCL